MNLRLLKKKGCELGLRRTTLIWSQQNEQEQILFPVDKSERVSRTPDSSPTTISIYVVTDWNQNSFASPF